MVCVQEHAYNGLFMIQHEKEISDDNIPNIHGRGAF